MKKKIIIISISIVLLLGLILLCFNISQARTNNKNELKETSHNLDEIYELISTGAYYKSDDTYSEDWIEFNYVLTHFYDYFNKDTKFMIYNKSIKPFEDDEELEDIVTIMITYDEYMKIAYDDKYVGIVTMIKSGEERLKEQDNRRGREISIAAKELVGSCAIVNKCTNQEENNKL